MALVSRLIVANRSIDADTSPHANTGYLTFFGSCGVVPLQSTHRVAETALPPRVEYRRTFCVERPL
jgi:hypothetical protein